MTNPNNTTAACSEDDELAVATAIVRIRELFQAAPWLASASSGSQKIPGCGGLVTFADLKAIQEYADAQFEAADVQASAPRSASAGDGVREALEPFVKFVSASAFRHFPDDFVLTTGSSMAMRQLTAGDFRTLLAAISVNTTAGADSARLDFLEQAAKRSYTGVSFDWIPSVDGERSGYRFMRHHYLGGAKDSIRSAIDAEIASNPLEGKVAK